MKREKLDVYRVNLDRFVDLGICTKSKGKNEQRCMRLKNIDAGKINENTEGSHPAYEEKIGQGEFKIEVDLTKKSRKKQPLVLFKDTATPTIRKELLLPGTERNYNSITFWGLHYKEEIKNAKNITLDRKRSFIESGKRIVLFFFFSSN